ncbi:hypothetical protein WJX73_005259 [Symbiochloris irregularis]|uniref:Ubiquitin-like protease family profile domain-containing protein n=1 Tax=Symbiochloris irregularis TaxID=706552 RepID=A0AAW1NT66_9CHLO
MPDLVAEWADPDIERVGTLELWRWAAAAQQAASLPIRRYVADPTVQRRRVQHGLSWAGHYDPWVHLPSLDVLPPSARLQPHDFVLSGRRAWFCPVSVRSLHHTGPSTTELDFLPACACGARIKRHNWEARMVIGVEDTFLIVGQKLGCTNASCKASNVNTLKSDDCANLAPGIPAEEWAANPVLDMSYDKLYSKELFDDLVNWAAAGLSIESFADFVNKRMELAGMKAANVYAATAETHLGTANPWPNLFQDLSDKKGWAMRTIKAAHARKIFTHSVAAKELQQQQKVQLSHITAHTSSFDWAQSVGSRITGVGSLCMALGHPVIVAVVDDAAKACRAVKTAMPSLGQGLVGSFFRGVKQDPVHLYWRIADHIPAGQLRAQARKELSEALWTVSREHWGRVANELQERVNDGTITPDEREAYLWADTEAAGSVPGSAPVQQPAIFAGFAPGSANPTPGTLGADAPAPAAVGTRVQQAAASLQPPQARTATGIKRSAPEVMLPEPSQRLNAKTHPWMHSAPQARQPAQGAPACSTSTAPQLSVRPPRLPNHGATVRAVFAAFRGDGDRSQTWDRLLSDDNLYACDKEGVPLQEDAHALQLRIHAQLREANDHTLDSCTRILSAERLKLQVEFEQQLDLTGIEASGPPGFALRYILTGVTVKSGGQASGHYETYSKEGDSWQRCSDASFEAVSWEHVKACTAIALYYQLEGWSALPNATPAAVLAEASQDALRNAQDSVAISRDSPAVVIDMESTQPPPSQTGASHASNADEVVVHHEGTNIEITRKNMACLKPGEELTDQIMNVYIGLLQDADSARRRHHISSSAGVKAQPLHCHFFSSFFVNVLYKDEHKYQYPLIDLQHKELLYYDSLGGKQPEIMAALRQWVQDEYEDKLQRAVDTSAWPIRCVKKPAQRDSSSCGVFVLTFAKHCAQNAPMKFKQDDMDSLRLSIASEITSLALS